MASGKRHRARVAALQALYEADNSRHAALDAVRRITAQERLPANSAAFAEELLQGVVARQAEIDQVISRTATEWPVEQLAPVDRNILRLAISEMLGDNGTPVGAVINEAVELAKSFGSENSAKFVNGVLGTVARERREQLQANQPAAGKG